MNGKHASYKLSEIAQIVHGQLIGQATAAAAIDEILIDSRRLMVPDHCLFVALTSQHNDGHRYIEQLYNKGLRNFLVQQIPGSASPYPEAVFIVVSDTRKALQQLAAHHRKQHQIPVIGITGSNGKTIVKEWLYQILHTDQQVVRSPKSFNSQIGVPLSVWQLQEQHQLAIFEAGISEPEEMDALQKMIQPSIGIFTNLGAAHDENFISAIQKAGEKLKLFTKVDTLIYSPDYVDIQQAIIRSQILDTIHVFTWSWKQPADLRLLEAQKSNGKTILIARYKDENTRITIPFIDHASIENAIHCWALLLLLDYPETTIQERMEQLQPLAMRLELKEGINQCSVINDSYSSDINSLAIALDFLNQQSQHPNKTVILSDILQSGRQASELYGEIARLLKAKGINRIIGIGPTISQQAKQFTIKKTFYPNTVSFLQQFSSNQFAKESILLKGARIFEFEQISHILQQKAHETVLEIDLNALVHNLNFYRARLAKHTKVMAMVKAFSYGSGSYEIARVLQFHNIDYLTVAFADEGLELRKAGITTPIMVMNPEADSLDSMIQHQLEPEIYNFRVLDLLERAIGHQKEAVKIHIKVDTGMHRLGFEATDLPQLISRLQAQPQIRVQSVFSHLAAADNPQLDHFTHTQIERFEEMSNQLEKGLQYPLIRHLLNSAGISRFPQFQYNMVRLGISLYGIAPVPEEQKQLRTVSTLKSIISQIKTIHKGETIGYNRQYKAESDLVIGVVPIGYADGLNRLLSNGKGQLSIKGKQVPIVGNICMDMCMVDLSQVQAREGDEVIIFGESTSLIEMAQQINTIPYEILTGISRRVKRIYYQE